jgi:oxygen-independent coproporphyrinogen III oxidase
MCKMPSVQRQYVRRIQDYGLATAHGLELTTEDKVRAAAIESLMCELRFSEGALRQSFGAAAEAVCRDAKSLIRADQMVSL